MYEITAKEIVTGAIWAVGFLFTIICVLAILFPDLILTRFTQFTFVIQN